MPAHATSTPVRLITLDPGHFHAALVQKFMYPDVDPLVHVYSPGGDELKQHLDRIERFNSRAEQPTRWVTKVYTGPDYFQRMLTEKKGNVVVLSGNNARKAEYILRSIEAGFHVLADKPMIITPGELPQLDRAFAIAAEKGLLLYDIMTERHEITTLLQREFSRHPALFGELVIGSPENPALIKESVHHFSKLVAGLPLKRPTWFFDVRQQGEGIVDVTTHLVDLVQWGAFPGQTFAPRDVTVMKARHWKTPITLEQFRKVSGAERFPDFLIREVKDEVLGVFANGELTFRLRGVHARVSVIWNFEAPSGGGDTHYSIMRGTKANLLIRQGAEQKFKPILYVEKLGETTDQDFEGRLMVSVELLRLKYPGIDQRREGAGWRITVPPEYDTGHESHFGQVTENFLSFLREGRMPEWEVPNMLTKYRTLMQAYALTAGRS